MQGQFFVKWFSRFVVPVVAIVACVFSACGSADEPFMPPELNTREHIPQEFVGTQHGLDDPHIRALSAVRDEISLRVLQAEPDWEELRAAYLERDQARIQHLIGLSDADLQSLTASVEQQASQLLARYPQLGEYVESLSAAACTPCDVNTFFDNHAQYLQPLKFSLRTPEARQDMISGDFETTGKRRADLLLANATSTVDCKWGPYYASLLVCAASGPLLYWPCAYLAICANCSGGWVDDACFAEDAGDTGGNGGGGSQ